MTLEILRIGLREILANKLRSGLTVLGILIGTAAVVLLVAIGVAISNQVQLEIQNLGTNTLYVIPETNDGNGEGGTNSRRFRLDKEDVKVLSDRQRAPAVSLVAPAQQTTGRLTWQGASYTLGTFHGSDPSYASIRNITVKAGRLLTEEDEASRAKVAVVGSTVVERLLGKGVDPIGQDVDFNGVRLRVVGLLSTKGSAGAADQDDIMLAPLSTTIEHVVGSVESYSFVVVQAVSREALPDAMTQVTDVLRQSHELNPDAPPDFTVINASELADAGEAAASGLQIFLAVIALISLLVGGIGVMNIMLVTVTERTHEIGIRKALGAQKRDVLTQFLAESTLLAGLGGVLGVIVGVGLGQLPLAVSKPVVQPSTVVVSFGVSVLVGIFFGVYPARRAAALTPIEALRYE